MLLLKKAAMKVSTWFTRQSPHRASGEDGDADLFRKHGSEMKADAMTQNFSQQSVHDQVLEKETTGGL